MFCYWLKREHNLTYIPQLNHVGLNLKIMASLYFMQSTRSIMKFFTIDAKNRSYLGIRFVFTSWYDFLSNCTGEWGLDEFIFANDLVDSDKHLCWLHRLSSGLPDYRQRMGFACQQVGFVLCVSYPCWRTVPRGSGGRGEGVGYPHRSTNLQITGTVTGGKYERRTRVPVPLFECHYWWVTVCIRRTECCICLSLYWGPHVISHCLLSQGCSNFFAWGPPPDLFILVYTSLFTV